MIYTLHPQAHLLQEQKAFIIKISKLEQFVDKYKAGKLSSEQNKTVPEVFKLWHKTFKEFEAFLKANEKELETNFYNS